MLHTRTPEEYPKNLGLPRPELLRTDFDKFKVLLQAERCYQQHTHIRLITFWGVGWKAQALESDRLAMAHLGIIAATLQNTLRKGVRLTLLLGDTHAGANEVSETVIGTYVQSIRALAGEFAFESCLLSNVCVLPRSEVDQLESSPEEDALYTPDCAHYEKSARRLQAANAERRARKYFLVRCRERAPIAAHFPHAILASHDILQRASLAPELPTIFIHLMPFPRLRKLKPWFLENY